MLKCASADIVFASGSKGRQPNRDIRERLMNSIPDQQTQCQSQAPSRALLAMRVDALTPAHKSLHNNFMLSIKALRRDLIRSAFYLQEIKSRNVHRLLGFSTLSEYGAAAAGLTKRQCRDFLAVAKALPRFPEVESALNSGSMTWTHARLICSQTSPEEQKSWVEAARTLSTRQLEGAIKSQERAACPPLSIEPPRKSHPAQPMPESARQQYRPRDQKHFITLSFDGEQYARWQRLAERVARESGIAEAVLAGLAGGNANTVQTLIVILECPSCRQAIFPTNRGELEVPKALLEAAYCDAVIEESDGRRRHTIPPRMRRLALQRARYRCESAGCRHTSFLQVHHRRPVANGGSARLSNLVVLCSRCHKALHENEVSTRDAIDRLESDCRSD